MNDTIITNALLAAVASGFLAFSFVLLYIFSKKK